MLVERLQHSVDRRLDQLPVVGFVDIERADAFEEVAEQIELTEGLLVRFRRLRGHRSDEDQRGDGDRRENITHKPCSPSVRAAIQGSGLIGLPSWRHSTYSVGPPDRRSAGSDRPPSGLYKASRS